jgi:hypothetical protein
VINTNGTVSVVAGSITPFGSQAVFGSSETGFCAAVYHTAANKVVIAYAGGGSGFGTAIVGTVSGTSISFGTPVVFNSANTQNISIAYDSSAQKVVVTYAHVTDGYGASRVGTVSGTSISFGAQGAFEFGGITLTSTSYSTTSNKTVISYMYSGGLGYSAVGTVSGTSISLGTAIDFNGSSMNSLASVYHVASDKIVISYTDNGNSNYGSASVVTICGTSISFGSEVVFSSSNSSGISIAYDSVNQKVVISYRNAGNSNYGTSIVGTVSGTSISFGTASVFETAAVSGTATTYDASAQKIIVSYIDQGNSNYGTSIAGTVSGTGISFESANVFESADTLYISSTYNSTAQKVVIAYRDQGNSNYGTSVVYTTAYTNLTSENYIGISSAAYTNGQTAKIQLAGSVDDAQTSLTAGQSYFVQGNGTLGLTPSTPSVFAGTAVSSTKLIIKG